MPSDFCFVASLRLNLYDSRSPRFGNGNARCALDSGRTNPSQTNVTNETPVRVHRVLPENLPTSQRPPSPPIHVSVPWIGIFLESALGIDTESYEKSERYGPIY